jgi:hypothetical protein
MARKLSIPFFVALLAIPTISSATVAADDAACLGLEATIVGTPGNDVIHGTDGRDVITAGEGNDVVFGDSGYDVICGGPGRDRLMGGRGDDRLFGNRGKDILVGGLGFDRLNGGKSLDACYAGPGGGDVVECEEADLQVTIFAPASVEEGANIDAWIRVQNLGSKPSHAFTLVVEEHQRRVECLVDRSMRTSSESLAPGESKRWRAGHINGCQITGADPFIRIVAHVRQKERDERRSNDSDAAFIDFHR